MRQALAAAAAFGAVYLVVLGWVPPVLDSVVPFVRPLVDAAAPHREPLALAAVALLYASHAQTLAWYRSLDGRPTPWALHALLSLHALLLVDGLLSTMDPTVTVPEHLLLARSCALGNAALFAHLLARPVPAGYYYSEPGAEAQPVAA